MTQFFQTLIDWYLQNLNYVTLTILMAIESSFLPLPSEIIIPAAAWKAASGEMDMVLVVVFGTLGSLIGATFNYVLALWLGRPILHKLAKSKWARFLLIEEKSVEKAEAYFRKYGNLATFLGRLVLGVRHLISIPAGVAKMKLVPFWIYTALGAMVWCSVLAFVGYLLRGQKELLTQYSDQLSWGLVAVAAIVVVVYIVVVLRKKKPEEPQVKDENVS